MQAEGSALDAFVAALIGDGQLLAALPATGGEHCAATSRGHALTESVLVATLANRGLKSPFHDEGVSKIGSAKIGNDTRKPAFCVPDPFTPPSEAQFGMGSSFVPHPESAFHWPDATPHPPTPTPPLPGRAN